MAWSCSLRRYLRERKANAGPALEEEEYVKAIFKFLIHLYSFCISDYLSFLKEKAAMILGKYHDPIIEDRIQQWREGKKHEPQDLLDVLVSLTDDNGISLLSTDESSNLCTPLLDILF
ncbi:hypothetical protein GOBAR_AA17385 [Gossypium barbadense]|uniref:Uncharacterized protein n=1 Tax=Gossypium barbadense TaxID=3634 RepID=A0A2P5XIU1_GOSBA|nr:hypothetical protein GOBAR_AA17385 [Gossypium barbadense]